MPVKISSDMPLPMPRSVICSPSHMMNVVPAVSVMMVIEMKPMPGFSTNPPPDFCKRQSDTEGLHQRQDDGEVAGPLRDLAAAQLAFLLEFFKSGNHHRQQLQNDGRSDVGHDAQGEDGQPAEHAAAEQVDKAEQRTRILLEELSQPVGIDSRRRDVTAKPVHGQ